MPDIQSRADIELLITTFYEQATHDPLIGKFFTEVVPLNWDTHIPLICDFWEGLLLGERKYRGNPMVKHIEMSRKEPLLPKHFERWLAHWEATIRANFAGEKAEEAITRAQNIARLMQFKVEKAG